MRIKPFDGRKAENHEYVALNHFYNQINAERYPDDPTTPLSETIADWQNTPPVFAVRSWLVWDDDRSTILAASDSWCKTTDDNRHLMFLNLQVLPAFRRQGLARQLLEHQAKLAYAENRRLIQAETNERVPAGEALMQRLGARMGLATHTNQLELSELDRALIYHWIEQALQRAADFELDFIDGRYPDEQLAALTHLQDVMNSMPRDGLELEDWNTTPEQVRQFEQSLFASGRERWTLVARHKPSGTLAGFTETVWNPHRPETLEQWGTGVWPQYRNHGLGRWLKAAMIERVLRERPQVKRIRTGNADSNGPMLKINHALGFKPYQSVWSWQVETSQVLRYLQCTQPQAVASA